jgi:hypothetical protein
VASPNAGSGPDHGARRDLARSLRLVAVAVIVIGLGLALLWPARGQPRCNLLHEFNCGGTADYRVVLRLAIALAACGAGAILLFASRRLRSHEEPGSEGKP